MHPGLLVQEEEKRKTGISKLSVEGNSKSCATLFFFVFFQKVAWLENCLKCTKWPGIERAMFFSFQVASCIFAYILSSFATTQAGAFPFLVYVAHVLV